MSQGRQSTTDFTAISVTRNVFPFLFLCFVVVAVVVVVVVVVVLGGEVKLFSGRVYAN